MKRLFISLISLFALLAVQAREVNNPVAAESATIRVGSMRFTVLTPQMLRIQYSAKQTFEDRATFTVVNRNLPIPAFTYSTADGYFHLSTDSLSLTYKIGSTPSLSDKSPANLSVTFKMNGKDVLWYPGKDDALNLKGTTRTLDGASGDSKRSEMENGIISRAGWSVLDESPSATRGDGSKTFALEKNDYTGIDWLKQPVDPDATDWYICCYGHNYTQALGDFVKVAGRIPMPPQFAFGYWYSRYWKYTAQDLKDIVDDATAYNVPLDVMVIDKDWHINDWTGWSWNKSLFPDPKGLIDWMHARGLKVTLNVHPADGVNSNEDNFSTLCTDLKLNASSTTNVPWQLTDTTFYKYFFKDLIRLRENEGVDFWWLDWQQWLTDKNVSGLGETFWCNHVFYEDMMQNRTDRRPMIFHRWGGLGSHRYQVGFSGDTWADFQTLNFEPYFTATASNVGYGYWGHDLGGHNQYGANDPELYLRWLQFGVFTPIFRTHASNGSNIERRIWKFSNFPLLREAIRLRVQLFPYIYTAAREAYDTGVSICRPLYYTHPEESNAYDYENEYMFGGDIFVSPITSRSGSDQTTRQTVWLPDGKWWNVCRSTLVNGNTTFTDHYTQAEIPYFFRAGSIIPLYPVQRSVTLRPDTITLKVVPGADGQSSLYEDEGDTEGYKDNQFTRTPFTQQRDATGVTLQIGPRTGSFPNMPTQRTFRVEFLGLESPQSVSVNGAAVKNWSYNETTKTLSVTVPKATCDATATVAVRAAEVNVTPLDTLALDTDLTEGLQQQISTTQLWITGSAVPGGTQKLMLFPYSQYKFAGTLNPGTFKIINASTPAAATRYLAPSTEDANIVTNGTAFTTSTNTDADGWNVPFPDSRYKLTVNVNTKKLTGEVARPWPELYLVGGCAECGWTEGKMLPFTCSATNPYLWTWTGVLKKRAENVEPKRFKIMGQNGWSPKAIHPFTQDENVLNSTRFVFNGDNDYKWQIVDDGFYRVTLNLLTETFHAEYLGTEAGIVPAKPTADVQISSAYRTIIVRSAKNIRVEIYDETGRFLASAAGNDIAVNMDKPGIYFVKATAPGINIARKIALK
jgi:alpha-glucosidase (family GH31 glycosyl hydrolase)